jgi:excisionase family DNA binding protein
MSGSVGRRGRTVQRQGASESVRVRAEQPCGRNRQGASLRTERERPEGEGRLLRVRDVARMLAISTRGVWRLAASGEIPAPVRVGGSTRWRQADLQRFVTGQRAHERLTESERTSEQPD